MNKPSDPFAAPYAISTTFAGVDVSKDHVDVRCFDATGSRRTRRFPNTPAGHCRLLGWLGPTPTQVVVESTGRYSLDLTLALHAAEGTAVMVANPKALRGFANAQMRRTKTDAVDATVIADYARRMPFEAWKPPEEAVRDLQAIARRIHALTVDRAREKTRLQSITDSASASQVVVNDIEVNLRHLTRRIEELVRQATRLVESDEQLRAAYGHLVSVRGIAQKSAVLLLGELATLPDDMSVRQWGAHAGLDPKKHESGTSVKSPERISKIGNARIRRALYMPAHSAIRHEPRVRAFYKKLLRKGKPKMVAIVTVMRKLLHAIYGMLRYGQDFDGEKFYATPQTALATS
jgi:transposase